MRVKKKFLPFLVIGVFVMFSVISSGHTEGETRMLEAWFGDLTIIYNGQTVTSDAQPFIVNGTTYVPLRMMSNTFNKDISWDPATYTITINDREDPVLNALRSNVEALKAEVAQKNAQIARLEARVNDLENASSGTAADLGDLEDQLNKDYGEYKNIQFDISLSGDEKDITVRIEVSSSDWNDWNDLSDTYKKNYLQDICDDIRNEYEDADITGYVRDEADSSNKTSFYTTSSGSVRLD